MGSVRSFSNIYYFFLCQHPLSLLSSLAVWAVVKKKPLVRKTHVSGRIDAEGGGEGEGEGGGEGEGEGGVGDGWVTAVAAYPNSDLVASGADTHCIASTTTIFL